MDIQKENLQKKSIPKNYFKNKADERKEIDKVLDVIYALFTKIKLKNDLEATSSISEVHEIATKQKKEKR